MVSTLRIIWKQTVRVLLDRVCSRKPSPFADVRVLTNWPPPARSMMYVCAVGLATVAQTGTIDKRPSVLRTASQMAVGL